MKFVIKNETNNVVVTDKAGNKYCIYKGTHLVSLINGKIEIKPGVDRVEGDFTIESLSDVTYPIDNNGSDITSHADMDALFDDLYTFFVA